MAKDILDKIIDAVLDEEWLGKHGERLTARELRRVSFHGREGKVLRNVYIPRDDLEITEIDLLFITVKGIFVIESKNFSGWIFGNEKDRYWTQSLSHNNKYRFYNPVWQNRGHVRWLGEYLDTDVPMFSIVVFSERCELKKVTVSSDDVLVIKRPDLRTSIEAIWDKFPDSLEEKRVKEIYEKLEPLTDKDEAHKRARIADIQDRFVASEGKTQTEDKAEPVSTESGSSTAAVSSADAGESLVCPRCGGKLVLRTAKRGEHAGNQFYGCSNYPKCRYIRNL